MSHDQKPGKMRVVGGSSSVPQRRSSDTPAKAAGSRGAAGAAGGAAGTLTVAAGSADAGALASTPAEAGKPVLLLAIVFVAGCAIGGAALPLLGII